MYALVKLVALELFGIALLLLSVAVFTSMYGCAHTKPVPAPVVELAVVQSPPPCPPTVLRLVTNEIWTARDDAALETAGKTCATRYAPRSRCLKVFTRIKQGEYAALCGPAN